MFIWPAYYEDMNIEKIKPVNASIQQLNLGKFKFLSIDNYKSLFENNETLKELIQTTYANLPEKYARSESANVKS
jgi:hypothetical protein